MLLLFRFNDPSCSVIKKLKEASQPSHNIYGLFFFQLRPPQIACLFSFKLARSHRAAANAHRPIINMILYDSFQYTSIVVMLR